MDCIGEKRQASAQAPIPERDRHDAALAPLALDPLEQKAHRKGALSREPDGDPNVFRSHAGISRKGRLRGGQRIPSA